MAYDSLFHPCKICGGELPNDISSHPVLAECVKFLTEKLFKTREWCQEIDREFNRLKVTTNKELTKIIGLESDVKSHTEDISTVYDNLNSFGGMLKTAGVWLDKANAKEPEDEVEETGKFISWKRHEEYLRLAEQEGYRKGVAQGQFQFEHVEWNKAYQKGLDKGYITAQRDIISKMKSVLDYDKETDLPSGEGEKPGQGGE